MQALSPLSVKQMSTILHHSHYASLLTAKEERAQLCLFDQQLRGSQRQTSISFLV